MKTTEPLSPEIRPLPVRLIRKEYSDLIDNNPEFIKGLNKYSESKWSIGGVSYYCKNNKKSIKFYEDVVNKVFPNRTSARAITK